MKNWILNIVRVVLMCSIIMSLCTNVGFIGQEISARYVIEHNLISIFMQDNSLNIVAFLLLFSLMLLAYYRTILLLTNEFHDTFKIIQFHSKSDFNFNYNVIKFVLKTLVEEYVIFNVIMIGAVSMKLNCTMSDLMYIERIEFKILLCLILISLIIILFIKSKLISYSIMMLGITILLAMSKELNYLYALIILLVILIAYFIKIYYERKIAN